MLEITSGLVNDATSLLEKIGIPAMRNGGPIGRGPLEATTYLITGVATPTRGPRTPG